MKVVNPILFQLSKRAKDSNLDPVARMVAMISLNEMVQILPMFVELPNDIQKQEKPEYVWRNGARVKVK